MFHFICLTPARCRQTADPTRSITMSLRISTLRQRLSHTARACLRTKTGTRARRGRPGDRDDSRGCRPGTGGLQAQGGAGQGDLQAQGGAGQGGLQAQGGAGQGDLQAQGGAGQGGLQAQGGGEGMCGWERVSADLGRVLPLGVFGVAGLAAQLAGPAGLMSIIVAALVAALSGGWGRTTLAYCIYII